MVSGKQLFIGVLIVTLIIGVIIWLSQAYQEHTVVRDADGNSVMVLVKPSLDEPKLVEAGKLPLDGLKFVVASEHTGKFLADSAMMTDDIKLAKIFTYNSKAGHTVEEINNKNTSDDDSFTSLIIGISGDHALVGSLDSRCSNGNPAYAIILNGDIWVWGSVQCNIDSALSPQYVSDYGVVFYYV